MKEEDETKLSSTLASAKTNPPEPQLKVSQKANTGPIPRVRALKETVLSQFNIEKITRLSETESLTLYVDKITDEKVQLTIYAKPKSAKPKETRTEFAVEAGRILALDHPAVLKGKQLLEDKKSFAIVWEAAEGGVLLSEAGNLDIEVVTKLAVQLFEAFAYCHNQGITHLRLSPAHLLLTEPPAAQSWVLKLAGLDESRAFAGKSVSLGSVSPFIAPEVYAGEGCKGSDLWSCGVVIYSLTTGSLPFLEDEYSEAVRACRPLQVQLTEEKWVSAASPALQALVLSLLSWDPAVRPSAVECLQHPSFKSTQTASDMRYLTDSMSTVATVKSANNKLKTEVKRFVIESAKKQAYLAKLREVFRQLDVDGDGMINKTELRGGLAKVLPAEQVDSECERIFKAADFNDSGELDYSEFLLVSYSDKDLFSTENLRSAFDRLDLNRSGNLRLDELGAMFKGKARSKLEKQLLSLRTKYTNELDFIEFQEIVLKSQVVSG